MPANVIKKYVTKYTFFNDGQDMPLEVGVPVAIVVGDCVLPDAVMIFQFLNKGREAWVPREGHPVHVLGHLHLGFLPLLPVWDINDDEAEAALLFLVRGLGRHGYHFKCLFYTAY